MIIIFVLITWISFLFCIIINYLLIIFIRGSIEYLQLKNNATCKVLIFIQIIFVREPSLFIALKLFLIYCAIVYGIRTNMKLLLSYNDYNIFSY